MSVTVLYLSGMSVSAASGGGVTVRNLLEPPPDDSRVVYLVGDDQPLHWRPFDDSLARTYAFRRNGPLSFRSASRVLGLGGLSERMESINRRFRQPGVRRTFDEIWRRERPDVLLAVPQGEDDLRLASWASAGGTPTVAWFLDDYWQDPEGRYLVDSLLHAAAVCFSISVPMSTALEAGYGVKTCVLNNGVHVPEQRPQYETGEGVLRMAYFGSLNGYYEEVAAVAADGVASMSDLLNVDVFSHERPISQQAGWRYLEPVAPSDVARAIAPYDAALLLSSFRHDHRAIAETSLASKIADYTSAGKPIVCLGPEYSANAKEVASYGLGVVCERDDPVAFSTAMRELVGKRHALSQVSARAWAYAKEHRELSSQRHRLWSALESAARA